MFELDLARINMLGFGRLAIIGIKLQAVSGSMQRNEVCVYGHSSVSGGRGHTALDVCSDMIYISFL